jgi:hypothetical protein
VTLEKLQVSLNQEIEKRIKAESEIQVTTILKFCLFKLQKLNDRSSTKISGTFVIKKITFRNLFSSSTQSWTKN